MIEDCTILLVTYNRHILLKQNIKYYQFYFSKNGYHLPNSGKTEIITI